MGSKQTSGIIDRLVQTDGCKSPPGTQSNQSLFEFKLLHLYGGDHNPPKFMEISMSNIVYIATSLDGYISAPDGGLDWLSSVPNPNRDDLGFSKFMDRVDAIVMGRVTFETVLGFGSGWHYPIPGIVLSSTMSEAPEGFAEHVQLANGSPEEIVQVANDQGFENLYIDGGKTIQRFLSKDLIDELIITEIPVLLGGGTRLFGTLDQEMAFDFLETEVLLGQLVKRRYFRKRS
jgi:dihydrofolate reductase